MGRHVSVPGRERYECDDASAYYNHHTTPIQNFSELNEAIDGSGTTILLVVVHPSRLYDPIERLRVLSSLDMDEKPRTMWAC